MSCGYTDFDVRFSFSRMFVQDRNSSFFPERFFSFPLSVFDAQCSQSQLFLPPKEKTVPLWHSLSLVTSSYFVARGACSVAHPIRTFQNAYLWNGMCKLSAVYYTTLLFLFWIFKFYANPNPFLCWSVILDFSFLVKWRMEIVEAAILILDEQDHQGLRTTVVFGVQLG